MSVQLALFEAPDILGRHDLSIIVGEPFRPTGREALFMREPGESVDPLQWVWVTSPHTGGQVRMYALAGRRLRHTRPDYRGPWPELDLAVAVRLGVELFAAVVWDSSGPVELWRKAA